MRKRLLALLLTTLPLLAQVTPETQAPVTTEVGADTTPEAQVPVTTETEGDITPQTQSQATTDTEGETTPEILAQANPQTEEAKPPRTPGGQKVEQLPIPIVSPTTVLSPDATPMSPRDKARLAFRNTFGWRAAANRLLQAGIDHAFDDPEEWPGDWEGFGMRYGNSYGRLAIRNGFQLAADLAFKTDPRYFRCDCMGFWARTRYAWKRVLVDRRDDGSDFPAMSNFAAAYGTPMIADQWQPDRENTWDQKLWNGTSWLALRGASNMIKEFWPEIRRTLRLEKFLGDNR